MGGLIQNPLKQYRRDRGLTQLQMATLSGLSEQVIRRVEHGTIGWQPELNGLLGLHAQRTYDEWRRINRANINQQAGNSINFISKAAVEDAEKWGTATEDAFQQLRIDLSQLLLKDAKSWSRAAFANLLKIDPRRIQEVESGERPLGIEYRRALLQIGVSAETLQRLEGLEND